MVDEVIRTDYLRSLQIYRDVDLIKVITGMRRVGKSTLMRQYISLLVDDGIPEGNIIYIDMDSMKNDRYKDGRLVYETVESRRDLGRQYVLIDEVQNINGWVRVVESLRNDVDCDIYVTGSNSHMLSNEISTLLTGRSVTITVLPLSLKEICTLNGENDYKAAFVRYIRHGGLPILRPQYSEEMTFQIINELKSDIILKDICNRRQGVDPNKIRRVIDYLYSEVGNPISVTKMSNSLGMSTATAAEYLNLVTDSMLFIKAERYNLKGRTILTKEPKYYCTDTGMRYSQPIAAERDFGKTLENIVFLELVRRGNRVCVGRTSTEDGDNDDRHLEIDFIVIREDVTDYYQVTKTLEDPAVYERELRPLRVVTGRGERYVLTYDDRPVSRGRDAIIMNIIDFLLEEVQDDEKPSSREASSDVLLSMFGDYLKVCRQISDTVVTPTNFDDLSTQLQERFFDLQAYSSKSGIVDDSFIQHAISKVRANNVRIFNAMVACVNANREPIHMPAIGPDIEELEDLFADLHRYVSSR